MAEGGNGYWYKAYISVYCTYSQTLTIFYHRVDYMFRYVSHIFLSEIFSFYMKYSCNGVSLTSLILIGLNVCNDKKDYSAY